MPKKPVKTQALEVIDHFIELKKKEKAAADSVSLLKPIFYKAMRRYPAGLTMSDAVIYPRYQKSWAYSRAILAAEKKLAALKAAFEAKNKPASIARVWAVKL